ncbi:uncharacterized protein EV154DRAFT_603119 [Mucor mucedo]|uniref:uncharacterized protein n=1 Tax=Mucor mucedo TaxID=29922 RepID=UPI00221F1B25|nr:uncharacterized protein EV154DRAFT_603119 [Mucor mucedo]KAI7890601.1 hypothetical protein EV154DRAFT_603119 [Mucor mucedo]
MAKKQEAEEYEVDYINNHRFAVKNGVRRLEYQVKWRGYPASESTWESKESTENAMKIVDHYWATKGGGDEARIKCEKILSGELSEDEDSSDEDTTSEDEDEEDEGVPTTRSNKRRVSPAVNKKSTKVDIKKRKVTPTKSAASTKKDATPKKEVPAKKEVPVPAKKATPVKKDDVAAPVKKTKTITTLIRTGDNTPDEEFSESEIERSDFRLKSNGWKSDAEKVIEVRAVFTDEGQELHGLVKWRDGKLGLYKTSELTKRIPQLLIKYYENKLTFEQKIKA